MYSDNQFSSYEKFIINFFTIVHDCIDPIERNCY